MSAVPIDEKPATVLMSFVYCGMEGLHRRQDFLERRRGTEDHRRRIFIVTPERIYHAVDGFNGKRASLCRGQVVIRAVEKHPGVGHAVLSQPTINERCAADVGTHKAVEIIIVSGDALALLP